VFANDPTEKKPPSSYKFDTFVHTAFLFTPERLKVPDWVWKGDTGSVEVRYSDGGLEFVARSKNGIQAERRFIDIGAIQCRANVLYLTWDSKDHSEGTTTSSYRTLALYHASSGDLVLADFTRNVSSTFIVLRSTEEHTRWFLFKPVAKQ
jgi:hypothetical protein